MDAFTRRKMGSTVKACRNAIHSVFAAVLYHLGCSHELKPLLAAAEDALKAADSTDAAVSQLDSLISPSNTLQKVWDSSVALTLEWIKAASNRVKSAEEQLVIASQNRRDAVRASIGAASSSVESESKTEEAAEGKEAEDEVGVAASATSGSVSESALPPVYEPRGFNRSLVSKRIAQRASFLLQAVLPASPEAQRCPLVTSKGSAGDQVAASRASAVETLSISLARAVIAFAVTPLSLPHLIDDLYCAAFDAEHRIDGMSLAAAVLNGLVATKLPDIAMPRDTNNVAHVLRWIPQAFRSAQDSFQAKFSYSQGSSADSKARTLLGDLQNCGYRIEKGLRSSFYELQHAVAKATEFVASAASARANARLLALQDRAPLSSALIIRREASGPAFDALVDYARQSTFHVDEISTQSQLSACINAAAFSLETPEDFLHAERSGAVESIETTLKALRAQAASSSYAQKLIAAVCSPALEDKADVATGDVRRSAELQFA